jgi:hypothetical protein
MITLLKPCLEQSIAGKRYSYGELATVMAEAAQVVNSHPIARGSEDVLAGRRFGTRRKKERGGK